MKYISWIFVCLFLLVGCGEASETPDIKTPQSSPVAIEDTIKIGLITSLTGEMASFGQEIKNTVLLYAKEYPDWGKRKVKIILEDGRCSSFESNNAAMRMTARDQIQVLLMDDCVGSALSFLPIANEKNIVQISTTLSSTKLPGVQGAFGFRTALSDTAKAQTLFDDIKKRNIKTLAIISDLSEESVDFTAALQAQAKEQDIQIVAHMPFESYKTDIGVTLNQMAQNKPQALILTLRSSAYASEVLLQTKAFGEIPIFGDEILASQDIYEYNQDSLPRITFVSPMFSENQTGVSDVLKKYQERYGVKPNHLSEMLATWDALKMIHTSVETVGYDGKKIASWLHGLPQFPGILGDMRFELNGENTLKANLLQYKDGKIVSLNPENANVFSSSEEKKVTPTDAE